jgi:hypothetical protein
VEVRNRLRRALFLVSDVELTRERVEEFSRGEFNVELYDSGVHGGREQEVRIPAKALLETRGWRRWRGHWRP